MVNHVRTLLMNRSQQSRPARDYYGEEYISPAYRPLTNLPQFLQAVLGVLFSWAPDRALLNFRLQQYLTVLHAGELSAWMQHHDSRITYRLGDDRLFQLLDRAIVTGDASTLAVSGERPPASDQQLHRQWQLALVGTHVCEIYTLPLNDVTEVPLVFTNGYSQPILLAGTSLQARIAERASVADQWIVDYLSTPRTALGTIALQLANLNEDIRHKLFTGAHPELQSFLRASQQPSLTLCLSGFLLATAWQLEAIRLGRG